MSTGCIKLSCFVLELFMCDQEVFSAHNIFIIMSGEQVLSENQDKYQPHVKEIAF